MLYGHKENCVYCLFFKVSQQRSLFLQNLFISLQFIPGNEKALIPITTIKQGNLCESLYFIYVARKAFPILTCVKRMCPCSSSLGGTKQHVGTMVEKFSDFISLCTFNYVTLVYSDVICLERNLILVELGGKLDSINLFFMRFGNKSEVPTHTCTCTSKQSSSPLTADRGKHCGGMQNNPVQVDLLQTQSLP